MPISFKIIKNKFIEIIRCEFNIFTFFLLFKKFSILLFGYEDVHVMMLYFFLYITNNFLFLAIGVSVNHKSPPTVRLSGKDFICVFDKYKLLLTINLS